MSCLCRALLTVVAVSCTLSRTHAHGQATQRLDRIKDLMCVFLLSGMQKEDLDVNMLTKLQRHNVNIGDMGDRELLQKCTRIKRNESMQNNSLQTTTESAKENLTKEVKIEMSSNKTDVKNSPNDNNTTNCRKENVTKSIIDYVDGQPDIQSVLNFWQNVKVNKSNIIMHFKQTEQPTDTSQKKSEQKNKRNIQYNPNVQDTDNVKRLITSYILRDDTMNTSSVKTNITNENGLKDSSFQQIYNNNNRRLIENDIASDNTNNFNNLLRLFDQYSKGRQRYEEESTTTPRITTRAYKNNTNINDLLNFLNVYKTYYPDVVNGKNKKSVNSAQELNLKKDSVTDKPFTILNNIINEDIPQNFVKEIAISVKDMILKELRKEMKSSPIGYTTVGSLTTYDTTEKVIPTINHNIDEVILNKFLDLFKEIKSLKQSSIIISNKNKPESEKVRFELKNENVQIKKTRGEEYDMEPTVQIYNNVESKPPILYNFSPQVHKLRTISKPKPIQISKPRRLITIQTNNMEIPPLGIPIDMPENPINQNIIVTTAQYRISRNKGNFRNVKVDQGLVFNDYVPKEKYAAIPVIDPYNSNFNQNYQGMPSSLKKNDRTNFEKHNKKTYPDRYTQLDGSLIVKAPIARYHEKLENGDIFLDIAPHQQQSIMDQIDCCNEKYAFSQQMIECCNSRIAARQQMSLSKVKKQSLYDAHYNNFVKSQKKVNDMLEKILASKNSNRIQAPGVQIA